MMLRLPALLALVLSLPIGAMEALHPRQVEQLFAEAPRLVVLWSVDCPPCYRELAQLKALLERDPSLPITLIATDDDPARRHELRAVTADFSGERLQQRVFAEGASAALRHAIDPGWSGVLPRSYFVDAAGNRSGHSGLLDSDELAAWFDSLQR